MSNNKKRAAATAAAVALGALLVLGGASMAWLQDSTKVTTNTFATNSNDVDLNESNTEFDIVPGTSEEKDPVVSASYTLDSYVYVVVYDNTQGLVEWEMDSSWTLLTYENGDPVTYKGGTVYYQTLTYTGDGDAAEFSDTVIEGSVVSYSSSLTNEDMAVEDDVTLAFQAFIMQSEISTDVTASALEAWCVMLCTSTDSTGITNGYTYNTTTGVVYTSVTDAISAAEDGDTITLLADANVSYSIYSVISNKSLTIDLNGYQFYLTI